ncbi:MAG: hypothetical protein KHY27_00170 [Butyricicoccus pullicaecorum]|nr:hypothetical protein [Butyricicoccus pullicaecorum]
MNPLFQAMAGGMTGGNNQIATLMQMLRGGNPEQIAQQMMQSNPRFKQFMEQNKGKTPEQVAKENGIDLGSYMGQFK